MHCLCGASFGVDPSLPRYISDAWCSETVCSVLFILPVAYCSHRSSHRPSTFTVAYSHSVAVHFSHSRSAAALSLL